MQWEVIHLYLSYPTLVCGASATRKAFHGQSEFAGGVLLSDECRKSDEAPFEHMT